MAEPKWINDEIKNKYDNSPFRIPLRNKEKIIIEYALVDAEDFDKVNKYKWHLSNGYAQGEIKKNKIKLHHFILKKPDKGNVIENIDEDKLNDKNLNLREVSIAENRYNKNKNKKTTEPIYINDEIKNKYDNSPFRIPLRNREGVIIEFALVDEEDFEKVNKYKWSVSNCYAQGIVEGKTIPLHHYILKKPKNGNVIDHVNQDKFNNEKLNLREVSQSVNSHNKIKNTNIESTSKYKGVTWNKKDQIWKSQCRINKKTEYLGSFEIEEEAAKAYDIYTFKKLEDKANNNNLVKYEDTLEININDIIKKPSNIYDLPKNIIFNKRDNTYRAKKNYKTQTYKGINREKIEEAIEDLKEINKKIELIKQEEEKENNNIEITRNNEGIPYIKVKDLKVLVDEEFWHKFNSMSWSINKNGYIIEGRGELMHRIVMNAKKGEIVDHINNTKYDNRNCNLRNASYSLNNHNKKKNINASSKYFGVSKSGKIWTAQIRNNNKKKHLGRFENEIDAAKAYNKKAIEIYGDKANLNVFN
jgi:hypothetical protein